MKIEVKYFALLREAVAVDSETIELEAAAATVNDVREKLCEDDPSRRTAFETVKRIRAAVNGEMAPMTAEVKDGDVVAFFPPVTGG